MHQACPGKADFQYSNFWSPLFQGWQEEEIIVISDFYLWFLMFIFQLPIIYTPKCNRNRFSVYDRDKRKMYKSILSYHRIYCIVYTLQGNGSPALSKSNANFKKKHIFYVLEQGVGVL